VDIQHHRAVGGQGFIPGWTHVLGLIHDDALEAQQLGIARIGKVRQGVFWLPSN
jgi:hypothetical protein